MMTVITRVVIVLACFCLWFIPFSAHADDGDVVISEVMVNSHCGGTGGACDGSSEIRFEWVEIYNKGTSAVEMSNWQICDSGGCDMFRATINPGEYLIIAYDVENYSGADSSLKLEMEQGGYGTYNGGSTIALDNSIGNNGLANTDDAVYLRNTTGGSNTDSVIDCVSWGSTDTCDPLTYTSGGTGSDDAPASSSSSNNGQSISNIGGTWARSGDATGASGVDRASPYGQNTHADGNPPTTAVTLTALSASNLPSLLSQLGAVATVLGLTALAVVAIRYRREMGSIAHEQAHSAYIANDLFSPQDTSLPTYLHHPQG